MPTAALFQGALRANGQAQRWIQLQICSGQVLGFDTCLDTWQSHDQLKWDSAGQLKWDSAGFSGIAQGLWRTTWS